MSNEPIKKANILDKVGQLYENLTKTEKRIANILLTSPTVFSQYSLAEIAKEFSVGEATFIRFCRTLGFAGFSDFKLQLNVELATKRQQSQPVLTCDIQAQDDLESIAEKVSCAIQKGVEESKKSIDYQALERVIKKVREAKRLFFLGVGASGITAWEAKYKFMRLGLAVEALDNSHFMYMQSALMNAKDVVIGISHSGYSAETLEALRIAKRNGAQTVALTHNQRSPMSLLCDETLITAPLQGEMQTDALSIKVAQLFVLDLIYLSLLCDEKGSGKENKQKTCNVILEQRGRF